MLHKLNKDELILIIENISKNHKKEIERIKDEYETIIYACEELGIKFRKCCISGCKAMRIKRGSPSTRYVDINCNEMYRCEPLNQYFCDIHAQDCHKN